MQYQQKLEIPYLLQEKDLKIDKAASELELNPPISAHLGYLMETNVRPSELERICRSATILYDAKAGTFQECFHTAIIWERG